MEDIHFLKRLERVSQPQVELALSLYRDPGLAHSLIESAGLPPEQERVAIALEQNPAGPHLVMTRAGAFVTCLGEGMSTGALPVVSRAKMDAVIARREDFRRRLEVARGLVGKEGPRKLLARVLEAGHQLAREELVGLSAWQPLLHLSFASAHFGSLERLAEGRERLLRLKNPRPADYPLLKQYWNLLFGVGHLSVLACLGGYQEWMEPCLKANPQYPGMLSWGLVRQGVGALALQGIWGVGRVGKPLLSYYKQAYHLARGRLQVLNSLMGLAILGLGHSRLEAEARKAIARIPAESDAQEPIERQTIREKKAFGKLIDLLFEDRDGMIALHRYMGQQKALELGERLPEGSPYRFSRCEDVPDELAMPLSTGVVSDLMNDNEETSFMLIKLPWLARARAEDLYLPRDYIQAIREPIDPRATMHLVLRFEKYYGKPKPVSAPRLPGRNEPCSCGSGKKYKRCCG